MEETSNVKIFHYDPTNFNYTLNDDETQSKFDTILRENWERAEESGVLRYKLEIKEWKILKGHYKFLAQLNPDRGSNRRTPEDISSMSQPFDPDRFNFTKLPLREIFLDMGDGSGNDVIAANVSPIEWGHCLYLPDRMKCLPQKMTESSLGKALELLLLSNSLYFRVLFNSLCAHASVNHLHWHFYYLKHQMLLENIELEKLEGPLFALKDYPAKGFCFKLSSCPNKNIESLGSWAFIVINYLNKNNIAHNVYITRAKTESEREIYDDIRVYIWARKTSSGVKDTQSFVIAVCELFGHLSVKSEEEYKNLSEEKVVQLLANVTADVFTEIKDSIRVAIRNKIDVKI